MNGMHRDGGGGLSITHISQNRAAKKPLRCSERNQTASLHNAPHDPTFRAWRCLPKATRTQRSCLQGGQQLDTSLPPFHKPPTSTRVDPNRQPHKPNRPETTRTEQPNRNTKKRYPVCTKHEPKEMLRTSPCYDENNPRSKNERFMERTFFGRCC